MAIQDDVEEARRLTDGAEEYTTEQIQAFLEAGNTPTDWARTYWEGQAASYARLVNVSESGSSRSFGDLYKNALAMADRFKRPDLEDTGVHRMSRPARRR